MISQTLMDKLLQLRLPAFRDGLREQISNPQYAALSFEDRLLLLVDLECNRRLDSRTQRRLKVAEFPMRATIEDLDFSPERGLERRLVLELSQCNWVDKALNISSGRYRYRKIFPGLFAWAWLPAELGYSVRYLHTARFLHTLNMPAEMVRISTCFVPYPRPKC